MLGCLAEPGIARQVDAAYLVATKHGLLQSECAEFAALIDDGFYWTWKKSEYIHRIYENALAKLIVFHFQMFMTQSTWKNLAL